LKGLKTVKRVQPNKQSRQVITNKSRQWVKLISNEVIPDKGGKGKTDLKGYKKQKKQRSCEATDRSRLRVKCKN
jgi:hypothetical protein